MKISVFGLGYVGCVTAACLAQGEHEVIGVDINPHKVELIRSGHSPILEPGLDELVANVVQSEKLQVTLDTQIAIKNTEASLICVGTPSNGNGSLKLDYIENVSREIGTALADKEAYHVVVVRSTVLPTTVRQIIIPTLEKYAHKKAGVDIGVCMNPEFLREGNAIQDYYDPSYIIIGELDQRSGDVVQAMYESIDAPVVRTSLRTAEMLKYTNNAFHALKVAFANEIGRFCKEHQIDGQEIMELVCQDQRLNISPTYLKPGFAFGGSCLPKDVRALVHRAKERDIDSPILNAVMTSNARHIQRGIEMVEQTGRKKIGILGLSFKADTDDVRESPIIPVIETLIGRGYEVSIYDAQVELTMLMGKNKSFLEQQIPHIASLMKKSIDDVATKSEVLVIANNNKDFQQIPGQLRSDQILIDFVGTGRCQTNDGGTYEGICW